MESLVEVCDFKDLLLKFLNQLFLLICAFLCQVCHRTNLVLLLFTLVLQLCVVLSQLAECLTGGSFNLETLNLLEYVSSVHTLDDSICIANELFFEYFSVLRENLLMKSKEW